MYHDLGHREELILLLVGNLNSEAYANSIQKEWKNITRKSLPLGTIHAILYRLEKEGLLKSELGGSTEKRGGRSKRFFTITSKGLKAISSLRELRHTLWSNMKLKDIQLSHD